MKDKYCDLRKFVAKRFKCETFQHLIVALQKLGFPPAQSFICLTYKDGNKYFSKLIDNDSGKKEFGKMIAKQMNELGYVREGDQDRHLYLHNAKMFIKQ